MKVFVPYPAVSEANRSDEHWAKKKRRHDQQKNHTFLTLMSVGKWNIVGQATHYVPRWNVHLCVHAHHVMDTDNLVGSVKYYRDEVARFLGIDDGNVERLTFSVSQQKPIAKQRLGVEISIEEAVDASRDVAS